MGQKLTQRPVFIDGTIKLFDPDFKVSTVKSKCHYTTSQNTRYGTISIMEYNEFRRQLGKAGLTNKAFAQLLGLNPISISNFKAKGEVPDQ